MFDLFRFDSAFNLVAGLLTGVVFGFLLQKGAVTRFRTIVGQFLWADHTVLRTMLTAVVVGGIGVWAMHAMWDVPLHVKSATIWANVVGGVIFGVGMAVLGYCPGTAVGAAAEGSRHAWFGLGGMLAGAAIYAEVHPQMKAWLMSSADLGKVTFADVAGVSPWWFIGGVTALAIVAFALLHGRGRQPNF